jgi:hypothetical protein
MTSGKSALVAAAAALMFCFGPSVGWSTRALGDAVSGEVTSAPLNGVIEIAHRAYHIKPNSAADKDALNFYAGQTVDAVLDGPAGSSDSQVIAITVHTGS